MTSTSRNIALVGCGAIAQTFYLPALAKLLDQFDQIWLIDPNDRALDAAQSIVRGKKAHKLSDVADQLQFLIIATPNDLHFPLAQEGLSQGAHVLIEKPYVIWPNEGRKLMEMAAARGRNIVINQTRRFFPYARELRRRIRENEFGALKKIEHREGGRLVWPYWSGAAFIKDAQRTGVIMDIGVHVLDFYQYLLEPEWSFVSAVHDGFSGPEGLAEIKLTANGAPVSIRLSRYQKQDNAARLSFELADVSVDVFEWNTFSIRDASGAKRRVTEKPVVLSSETFAERLLANFVAAGEGRERPVCDAASSFPVIAALDEIYRRAERYPSELGAV